MKYKAVIFDLDGVICHTDEYHYKAWKKLADELDIYFDREINNRLRGVSRMESFNIILEKSNRDYSEAEKTRYTDIKNDLYKELLDGISHDVLSEGTVKVLEELKRKGYKIAIGSSSKNASFILEKLDLTKYFDAISDGNNIKNSKPDPEVFLRAASYLNLAGKDCIVVEDAKSGVDAAIAAGMDCIGINEAADHEKVTYKIKEFIEILNIL